MKRLVLYVGSLLVVSSMVTAQAVRTTLPLGSLLPACNIGRLGWIYQIADATDYDDCTTFGATGNSRKLSVCVCRWTAGSSNFEWEAFAQGAGAGASPGGSDTQVQYNDGGAFGGDAGLTYNETTNVLTATGGFAGTIGGSTGATDNAVPRADGTGGATLQASALTVDDSGVVRAPTLGSELPTYSFTDAQDANNVRAGITAFNGNLYTIVNNSGAALRTINITAGGTTGAVGGWNLGNSAASDTVPNIQPDFADGNTGIGRAGVDQLSLIAGGVEAVRVTVTGATLTNVLKITPQASAPTCDAGAEGSLYTDTSHALCYCDGTNWLVTIGAGTCS